MMSDKLITKSSGNVFKDLGLPDPEERLTKAKLAFKISEIINNKHYTQEKAAKILCIPQPKVSLILNGKLSGFSLEKMIHYLIMLDQNVKILVTERVPCKGDNLILNISKATKKLQEIFAFPVPQPKHPVLAGKMPLWDYNDQYVTNHF